MAMQMLRRIDRWRFETPLAILLGAAAGFAAGAMPTTLFQQLPVLGAMGMAAQMGFALAAGVIFGAAGYALLRHPAAPAAAEAGEADAAAARPEEAVAEEAPVAADRLRRFRRADAHPDAPPREPIRASRDLGEPFMEVSVFAWEPGARQEALPRPEAVAIPEADFTDVSDEDVLPAPAETLVVEAQAEPVADIADIAEPEPVRAAPRAARPSLGELMDRLSAGLERRVRDAERHAPSSPPMRDMRPALRDALDELNRLAARRD